MSVEHSTSSRITDPDLEGSTLIVRTSESNQEWFVIELEDADGSVETAICLPRVVASELIDALAHQRNGY